MLVFPTRRIALDDSTDDRGRSDQEFAEDAKAVEKDLAKLKTLLEK